MIYITSIGEEALLAIQKGHDTNVKLATHFGGTPERMQARVAKLRKLKLVTGYKQKGCATVRDPMFYKVISLNYELDNSSLKQRINTKTKPAKTYADTGENIYECLDSFLYPKGLQRKLQQEQKT